MTISNIDLTERLDRLEQALPPIPSKSMAFGRATVRMTNDVVTSVVCDVARRVDRVFSTARTGTSTTVGQARFAGQSTTEAAGSAVDQTVGQARSAARRTAKMAQTAVNETVGQARSGARSTRATAGAGTKQTVGQARAQAERTIDASTHAAKALLDDATAKVDPDRPTRAVSYDQWTKAELYDRAQALDIDGRSTMSKRQLVTALRKAS